MIGKPTNPIDGEQIGEVEVVNNDEAIEKLEGSGRYDIADLYRLAHRVRSTVQSGQS